MIILYLLCLSVNVQLSNVSFFVIFGVLDVSHYHCHVYKLLFCVYYILCFITRSESVAFFSDRAYGTFSLHLQSFTSDVSILFFSLHSISIQFFYKEFNVDSISIFFVTAGRAWGRAVTRPSYSHRGAH